MSRLNLFSKSSTQLRCPNFWATTLVANPINQLFEMTLLKFRHCYLSRPAQNLPHSMTFGYSSTRSKKVFVKKSAVIVYEKSFADTY